MAGKWCLKNTTRKQFAYITEEALTLGKGDDVDIEASGTQEEGVILQLVLGSFIFLVIKENSISARFKDSGFVVGNESFLLTNGDIDENFIQNLIYSENELVEAYHYINFREAVLKTQVAISEELATEDCSSKRCMAILHTAADILGSFFWKQEIEVNNKSIRFFESMLFACYCHIEHYGAISSLIARDDISEIMVNGPKDIYYEKKGKIIRSELKFFSSRELMNVVEKVVSYGGRRIDESIPYCDTRLPDGSRVHAIIPPLALNGPVLTIRKFSKSKMSGEDLVRFGSISTEFLELLKCLVQERKNILISGGTGTGKTTLLNLLSAFIPVSERIVTVEDSAELQLQQPHVIRLESRLPNMEGKGEVTLRELVKNSLRMRPDRIIIGECRGGEALDMLQAMNTGHDGSMTTTHANTTADALRRVETLVMFAATHLPSRAIREQIISGINYVVQLTRFPDGSRRITSLGKVLGLEEGSNSFLLQDIVSYNAKQEEWVWN